MAELKYKCLDFIIEPRKVLLEFTYKDGILISIPFLDNIPDCIKERLDQIVNYEFSEYLSNNQSSTLFPHDFTLDADLQLKNDKESGTQYFLSIMLLDLITKDAEDEILIQKSYLITHDDNEVYNAMKSYFQDYVNNTLFPK